MTALFSERSVLFCGYQAMDKLRSEGPDGVVGLDVEYLQVPDIQ